MSTPVRPLILVGVGNAGVTVLDLIALGSPGAPGLLVVNNDSESLAASVVTNRITDPSGDLTAGFQAIDDQFGKAVAGAPAVLLCGGLGGDTSSFLIPALAILAKAGGITTMACVGMPFSFEGKRKMANAADALEKLYGVCDAVVVIDNDRLSGGTPSTAAVGDAFGLPDRTLLAALQALRGMLGTSGPVKITRADIHEVFGVYGSQTHFGFGSAEGSNRLHEALERALKSPLLFVSGREPALREASKILILLRGPKDLSFAEVQLAVAGIEKIAGEGCDIKVGVQAEGPPDATLDIFIIASTPIQRARSKPKLGATGDLPAESALTISSSQRKVGSQDGISTPSRSSKEAKKTDPRQTQGTLDLDTHQRGRFDKSEPTIVSGENLDLPTFIRKGIKLASPSRH